VVDRNPNTKKSMQQRSYNKHIKKAKVGIVSYAKYEKNIKNKFSDHVYAELLTKIYKYRFAKKDLYMISVNKYAFDDGNITNIMNNIDQTVEIKKFEINSDNVDECINELINTTTCSLYDGYFGLCDYLFSLC
jgi:hypothetical protein